MENLDLQKLNSAQVLPVKDTEGAVLVIAGAGSGKTRVLTHRIAYLVSELNVDPSSILAITFTNKAADEMKSRLTNMIGDLEGMWVCTIHSMCVKILRSAITSIGFEKNFSIYSEDDKDRVLKRIIQEMNLESEKFLKLAKNMISNAKNDDLNPREFKEEYIQYPNIGIISEIYFKYEEELKKSNALDFDDLLLKTIQIFEECPIILEKWQNRIRHILVDEFQDVDPNQFKLVTLLAGKENEVTVVGDPDQTIYTWRGADIGIILNFDQVFEGCKTISLEQNYRSSGNILRIANQLIEHNKKRLKKNLFTKAGDGFEIAQYKGDNEFKEAEYVIDNINDLYDGKTTLYKDCAILYRTNAQSAALEQVLMSRGIKYRIYGGIRFYRRMEIKDSIAYLKLATNFADDLSCIRLIENTGRGIGKTTLDRIKANATSEDSRIFIHLINNYDELPILYKPKQGNSLQCFVKQIKELHDQLLLEPSKGDVILDDHLHKYGYFDILISYEMDEKIDNVHKFIEQMKGYLKQEGATLDEFIQNASLMSAQDEIDESGEDYVKLMTVHTAKGLEFDNVFIYGLVDQIFPSTRTIQESPSGIEEERRLFYVAITRAKKRLFLSTSGGYSYMGVRLPSRFLKEINLQAKVEQIVIRNDNVKTFTPTNIRAGSVIKHDIFGEGIVLSEHDGLIDVVFKDSKFGRKTLNASHKFVHLVK